MVPYLHLLISLHLFHLFLSLTCCLCYGIIHVRYDFFTPLQDAFALSLSICRGSVPCGVRSPSSWLSRGASSISSVKLSLLYRQVLLLNMSVDDH